jgi:YebC/PmpR family DNA-binding regulatory protein
MGRAFEYRRASKEKRWDKMSRIFPKLGKAITIAAKEGGSEPETNPKLRTAILNAKAQNMPKDNIDAAIKRAAGKDAETFIEVNYEGKGPHGVLIFAECATDNNTRTVANVKSYFNRYGCTLSPSGALEFMFERKAVFEFKKTDKIDLDELELELIDAGLESIESHEDAGIIYAHYTNFGQLTKALEEKGIEVTSAKLERIPTNSVEFTEEQLVEIEKLIDKLEEDDDVQAVYTNIA